MGRYVGNVWHEELADPGGGGQQGNNIPVGPGAPAPSHNGGGGAPQPAFQPPPANPLLMPPPSPLGDTNQQSVRADLRKAGYFIDNSGVYAPGAGNRVGVTWSGNNSGMNTTPDEHRLPVLNGTPVSPSNGFTGEQRDDIMYRGDPLYNQFFGQGTTGYSSTSMQANAVGGALPQGQGQYQIRPMAPVPAAPATPTAAAPSSYTPPTAETSAQSTTRNQPNTSAWAQGFQQMNGDGTGYGVYATSAPPELTVEGRYEENGSMIEKSVDQFGNAYFQTVGAATSAPPTAPGQPGPTAPQQPATPPVTPPAPAADDPTKGGTLVPLLGSDGSVNYVPKALYDQHKADIDAQAAAAAAAIKFNQGIEQQKVDVSKMVAEYQKSYNDALIAGQNAQLAQQMAIAQMQAELQRQTQELQRQQQGMTVSIEREKLDIQRRNQRGSRRALPQVRYK